MTAPPRLLHRESATPPELTLALKGAPGEPTTEELVGLATALSGVLGVGLPAPVLGPELPAVKGTLSAGATAGVASSKPLAVLGAWLVGGVALGAGLSGLVSSFVSFDNPVPRGLPAASVSASMSVGGSAPVLAVTVPDPPAVVPSAAPRSEARSLPSATPAVPAPTSTSVAASTESELSLLKRARQAALAEPAQALALTADHARLFPAGALEQEREMIAIDALLRLGRRAEAAQRAKVFQARYPGSAHARRLSTLVEPSPP